MDQRTRPLWDSVFVLWADGWTTMVAIDSDRYLDSSSAAARSRRLEFLVSIAPISIVAPLFIHIL